MVDSDSDEAIWNEVGMPDNIIEFLVNDEPTTETSTQPVTEDPTELASERSPGIELSAEQRAVLGYVKSGKSIFFTGSAGTGKSVLLRAIIEYFRDEFRRDPLDADDWDDETEPPDLRLAITAATGIASINIDGCTLHSWAGIGLGKEDARQLAEKIFFIDKKVKNEEYLKRVPRSEKKITAADRWKEVKILIVDEISMIDGVLFDKLEYIARFIRRSKQPFGGIQLIISGDFCQLPPVTEKISGVSEPCVFAFEANSWPDCIGQLVVLQHVFRQSDQAFVDMLNKIRFGDVSTEICLKFKSLSRPVVYEDGIEPTELYPTRAQVGAANSERLNQLAGPSRRYAARDYACSEEVLYNPTAMGHVESALERLIAPKDITLKVGAQVMLIRNLVQGVLVNGTRGRIEEFITEEEAETRSIKSARLPPPPPPPPPSPTPSAEEVDYTPPNRKPHIVLRHGSFDALDGLWPLVKFETGDMLLCDDCSFDVKNTEGKTEAVRDQVPLILAWALSVHKSQGQTLQRVRVNLGRAFEDGQAYVALSRATSMDTLEVLEFDPSRVTAHPRALKWNSQLQPAELILPRITAHDSAPLTVEDGHDDDERDYWAALGE